MADRRSESDCTCLQNSLDACASVNQYITGSTQGVACQCVDCNLLEPKTFFIEILVPLNEDSESKLEIVFDHQVFDYLDTDLIIRTSDSIEFKVFKYILGNASPIFSDMFLIGDQHPPTSSLPSDIWILVEVTETGRVMDTLLRYIYPTPRPDFRSLSDALDVLEAAIKYDIDPAVSAISNEIIVTELIEEDPLTAYLFASKHSLVLLKQSAMGRLISKDLPNSSDFSQHPKFNELESADLLRIMQCRSKFVSEALKMTATVIRAHWDSHGHRSKYRDGLTGLVCLQLTITQAIQSGHPFSKLETVLSTMSTDFGTFQFLTVLQCLGKVKAGLIDLESNFRYR